ncbi:DNA-repair protein XRCC2 [Ceratobasidium sp. AG-Ba]|nr:DNA-repair protein XRCC2 [Ceratobasidium sp. AG-Ba]QRW11253.1 DNA-repair protein XRCC2 [Ceratobasidium sp. AG-Ba]
MTTVTKPSDNEPAAIRRQSGLHLFNQVKHKTNPPGNSFIEGFDSHILRALPQLEQTSPNSTWARGDIIEIQGPAASGKTHLLYFWAMTCVLPYTAALRNEDSERAFEVLLGGRNNSVVVCDCDARWSMIRLRTIISRYLHERLALAVTNSQSDGDDEMHDTAPATISDVIARVLKRVHVFRPTSTLSLAATLAALPNYHKTYMPDEAIGMLMIDSISTFHSLDRWTSEQLEKVPQTPAGLPPAPDQPAALQFPELRTNINPLRHVLTVVLELRRSLGMITFFTNWGIHTIDSTLPSSIPYYKQHLRAPYPSPFDAESPRGKYPLTHHITIPQQGPAPFDAGTSLEEAMDDQNRNESLGRMRLRAFVRTISRRSDDTSSIVESEFEFAIIDDGVLVS